MFCWRLGIQAPTLSLLTFIFRKYMMIKLKFFVICNTYNIFLQYSSGDPYYGLFSVLFMIGPTFLAMTALLIELCSTKQTENPKKLIRFLKCFFHLPILQTVQTFLFYKKIRLVAKDKEETANFVMRIEKWIDDCGSFRLDEEWTWAKIKQSFKGRVSKEDKRLLKDLFKKNYQECCNGQASAKLKALTAAYQMEKEVNLAKVKSEIQEFKIYEAFGESAPQFILQACAILHKNPTLSIGMTSNNSFLILPFTFVLKHIAIF